MTFGQEGRLTSQEQAKSPSALSSSRASEAGGLGKGGAPLF